MDIPSKRHDARRPQPRPTLPGRFSLTEGDLIIGKANALAIGTLVERSTGYTLLVPLTEGFKAEQVAPALAAKISTLPDQLRRTLTWDQGVEMRDWKQVQIAAGIAVYFCDPKSPWQRATNENTYWYKMAGPEAPSTGVAPARAVG